MDRQNSEATAARAEAAARISVDSTDRLAAAISAVALGAVGGPAQPALRVSWSLQQGRGATCLLTNTGDMKACQVKVANDESLSLIDVPPGPDLEPGEGLSFHAAPDFETRDMTITVTWCSDSSGSPGGTWRYPLPV